MKIIDNLKNKIIKRHRWYKYYTKEQRNIEVPKVSLYEYIRIHNLDNMNGIAINYFGRKITYEEFFNDIDLCAKSLVSHGVREGDVVSICMANTPEAVISFYAINKIGATANMIHPLSAEEEIKNSLNATKSVVLIAMNICLDKIRNIISDTKVYKTIIVSAKNYMPTLLGVGYYLTADRKVKSPRNSDVFMLWNDFLEKGKKYDKDVYVDRGKDEAAVIMHSGGTSGTPKNILLSNGNINVVMEQAHIALPELDRNDSMLSLLPLFHCFGLVETIHFPLSIGGTIILVPKFDAARFDKLLNKYKPTVIPGVPTLFEAMINNKHMQKIDLSKVKYVVSGGDSLDVKRNEIVNRFLKEHGCSHNIIQGYGLTEASGGIIFGALGSDVLGSVGIPLPGNDLKIVDINTHEEVDCGITGEIMVSTPSIMMGYLNNEKETNQVLEKDRKGKIWLHTGDLGYINEDGALFFVQRLKRLIIVSGYNVFPSHIEEVLNKNEYILDSCVVGIPDPYKIQVPKAYIVLNEGINPTTEVKNEIKNYCKKNLSNYMIPKQFVYREELPKTMIGKVDYKVLENENK